jgi:hypothetical protein
MMKVNFHGCSEYVEHFWNQIPGEKQPEVVYRRLITKQDAIDWADLREGMTLHMMAHRALPTRELYVVSEAVTEEIDNLELNAQVVALLVAGARLVDEGDERSPIVIRTYAELAEAWGVKKLVEDPQWSELQLLSQRYYQAKRMRELNEYFISNSRVFTDTEWAIIADYKRAAAAYYGLFPRPERK